MHSHFAWPRFLLPFLLLALFLNFPVCIAAAPKWVEARSSHFTIVSDAGEKQAREVASQFEQIREAFQNAFPHLRADMGKPVIIFAVKNEDSMKALLPAYWEVKGHSHPSGIYIPGEDKHCAIVRTDIHTANPYEVLYHEYAHALEDLNFERLPLWLSEGIADFLGNSRIYDGSVEIGTASAHHLSTMRENKLIPMDVLLDVDRDSPYYNEQGRARLFYAESWLLVHYLLMDPDARQRQILQHFLAAYQHTSDQLAAAKQSFGDFNEFADAIDLYAHQREFRMGRVNTSVHIDPKSFRTRALPAPEVDALRGDLYTRTHRPKEAKAALEAALQQDPKLALAHEGLGLLALSQHETEQAEKEFATAVQLNSTSFLAYYFNARVQMRDEMRTPEDTRQVIVDLEKAIALNDQFAPAYEVLSALYSLNSETAEKAIASGKKAMQLEPGTFSYALSYGYVLVRIGKAADAKTLATTLQSAAKSPEDQFATQQLISLISQRERYDAEQTARAQLAQNSTAPPNTTTASRPPGSEAHLTYDPPVVNKHSGEDEYSVNGTILSSECHSGLPGKLALSVNTHTLNFIIPDMTELQILLKTEDVSSHPPPCAQWKGRHAVLFFYKLKNKQYFGELSTLQFF